jgi:glycosyltransferase involved in cell wall biosynthesis
MKYVYRWTAVSESTLKNTRKVFPADMREQYESKSKVIPMGVNVQDIAKYNLDKVSEELTALKGRDLILFIGRLAEIKGTDILIKSFSRIKFSKAVLVIAGDGPDKSKLVGLAKDLGISDRVYFTGYVHVDEKKYLLSIARLLVISSVKDSNGHTEGMPVVLMEGLAAGKIIVASNQSRAETIIENEVSGFIYDSRDVRMLSTTIDKVLSMDKKEYNAVQGQAKELSLQFDWSTVAKQHYEFLFKDLLE